MEAVRVGYITARDPKAHRQYLGHRTAPKRGTGLSGAALEAAVNHIGAMFPDNVIRVAA